MAFYSFLAPDWKKVHWIYGFETDFDIIEQIDASRAFFSPTSSSSSLSSEFDLQPDDDCLADPLERVTSFLRSEFDCIDLMLGWDPDLPSHPKTYVLVVHAGTTPHRTKEKQEVLRKLARLQRELLPDTQTQAKWYFSCEAGVWKGNVDWDSRPRQFLRLRKKVV